jgi:hypothetical protein
MENLLSDANSGDLTVGLNPKAEQCVDQLKDKFRIPLLILAEPHKLDIL